MGERKRVAAYVLGCKVNAYDTKATLESFLKNGYEYADFEDNTADVYIVGTCAVTNTACKKSRQALKRAARKNKDAIVIAAGCFAEENPNKCGADINIGIKGNDEINEIIEAAAPPVSTCDYKGRIRAYVKIQDGCDNSCSYCVVPYIRGRSRSRGMADCVGECEKLAEKGFKEIVLTGINAASYGKDLTDDVQLIDVIRAVSRINGIERVRLSSLDPPVITDAFINAAKEIKNLCDHFHLSLQSGCDSTLRRMNRTYTCDFYEEAVSRIRSEYPDAGLTTDIITGFPGESLNDFELSADFCKRIKFSKIHVFPYSQRKGTKAYDMPGQVPGDEKKRRTDIMLEIAEDLRADFLNKYAGRSLPILVESAANGVCEGHTSNYIKIKTRAEELTVNTVVDVMLQKGDMR